MPDELPEGHIQMGGKWANMGTPAATTRRRATSATAPVGEEVVEEEVVEEVEEEVVDAGSDASTDDGE